MTKYEFNYRLKNAFGLFLIVFLMILVIIGSGKRNEPLEVKADVQPAEVQVIEKVIYEVPDTPEEYIIYKFGEVDGKRGIKMLKECENKDLGLTRINWNGNGTWDFGLWQINQIHGYSQAELSDYRVNTDAAYKIFLKAGKSFSPWTCAELAGDRPFWK